MKAVVFLILAFLVAAMWWLGAGNAVCIGGVALGAVALLIAGLSHTPSPPTPIPPRSVTTRVEITKTVYEERLDYDWLQNTPQISVQNNYGRQPSAYLPTGWDVRTPPPSQRQVTVEHNPWPQIPLQQGGQHLQPGVKQMSAQELAQLLDQLNRGKRSS